MYPNNIALQHYVAEDYVEQNENEGDDEYTYRLENFKSWLTGDYLEEHCRIEDWSIKEFKKQRKRIRVIIKMENDP